MTTMLRRESNCSLSIPAQHRPMSRLDLERIRDWAIAKLSREKELKRTVHEYTKVRETAENILAAMDLAKSEAALSPTSNSAQTARFDSFGPGPASSPSASQEKASPKMTLQLLDEPHRRNTRHDPRDEF